MEGLEGRALLASVTEYAVPGAGNSNSTPGQIVAGPDGNLWFTNGHLGIYDLGEMTTSGKLTVYPCNSCTAPPDAITNGPDGALWFTDWDIGRITTSGQITQFPVLSNYGNAGDGIVTGPDGNLWFTLGGAIGRITTAGQVTQYPLPINSSSEGEITVGSDGRSGLLTVRTSAGSQPRGRSPSTTQVFPNRPSGS